MTTTDPIADMLTRIRNAQHARHDVVSIPASKMKIAIAHLLREEGFIKAYKCVRDDKQGLIRVALKYRDDNAQTGVIQTIQRISRPGLRQYVGADEIPYVKNGFGTALLSTSKGIKTCRQARKLGVGGELLCKVF